MSYKIVIAGSRSFNDKCLLFNKVDERIKELGLEFEDVEIVCGGCRGADEYGKQYATERGCELTVFVANWSRYDKAAGPIRNKKMAEYSNEAIVFLDGETIGSRSMINEAAKANIPCVVIK